MQHRNEQQQQPIAATTAALQQLMAQQPFGSRLDLTPARLQSICQQALALLEQDETSSSTSLPAVPGLPSPSTVGRLLLQQYLPQGTHPQPTAATPPSTGTHMPKHLHPTDARLASTRTLPEPPSSSPTPPSKASAQKHTPGLSYPPPAAPTPDHKDKHKDKEKAPTSSAPAPAAPLFDLTNTLSTTTGSRSPQAASRASQQNLTAADPTEPPSDRNPEEHEGDTNLKIVAAGPSSNGNIPPSTVPMRSLPPPALGYNTNNSSSMSSSRGQPGERLQEEETEDDSSHCLETQLEQQQRLMAQATVASAAAAAAAAKSKQWGQDTTCFTHEVVQQGQPDPTTNHPQPQEQQQQQQPCKTTGTQDLGDNPAPPSSQQQQQQQQPSTLASPPPTSATAAAAPSVQQPQPQAPQQQQQQQQQDGTETEARQKLYQVIQQRVRALSGDVVALREQLRLEASTGGVQGYPGSIASSKRWGMGPVLGQLQQVVRERKASVAGCSSMKKQLCKGILDWHQAEAEAAQRRREEAASARVAALRSSDMSSYMALLQQTKNKRLQEVLAQTDACLAQIARKLGQATLGRTAPSAGVDAAGTGCGSSSGGGLSTWDALAATLPADIPSQPKMLQGGSLREYQLQGLRWLVGVAEKGLNGILADDMGLGKTIQVIAMICHFVETGTDKGPFLIMCPSSVLSNWAAELATWAPDLVVVEYKGSAETRAATYYKQVSGRKFHVLLTSYELLMGVQDKPRLSRINWGGLVVDEGHRLKNADCKLSQDLRCFKSSNRLLLTGTPLQNKLGELWALLNFLMPDVFNSAADFDEWFGAPMQAIRDSSGSKAAGSTAASAAGSSVEASLLSEEEYLLLTGRLHSVLRPFMMRRLKEAVATELPGKSEVILRCGLSPYQSALYDIVKAALRAERTKAKESKGTDSGGAAAVAAKGVKGVNNTMMELRCICNHPMLSKLHPEMGEVLLKDPPPGTGSSTLPAVLRLCGKVDLLDQVLLRLSACGHKVLLFCTMTRCLDLIEEYLTWRGCWSWARLDGTSSGAERAEMIQRFNDPDGGQFLFLLSLRAGGVGLNLQAADTVIMFDSDWNPQIDLQAQARAHRIGQSRNVLVLRLLAADTIEEHILDVAEQKRKFADSSITGGFFDGQTSNEARRQYLLSILDSSSSTGTGAAAAEANSLTARALNQLIARGDDELQRLQEREDRLAEHQKQQQQQKEQAGGSILAAAAAARGGGGATGEGEATAAVVPFCDQPLSRLATAEDCTALIAAAQEAAAPQKEEDLSSYGRGMRGARAASDAETAASKAAAAAVPAAAKQSRRRASAPTASDTPLAAEPDAAAVASGQRRQLGSSGSTPAPSKKRPTSSKPSSSSPPAPAETVDAGAEPDSTDSPDSTDAAQEVPASKGRQTDASMRSSSEAASSGTSTRSRGSSRGVRGCSVHPVEAPPTSSGAGDEAEDTADEDSPAAAAAEEEEAATQLAGSAAAAVYFDDEGFNDFDVDAAAAPGSPAPCDEGISPAAAAAAAAATAMEAEEEVPDTPKDAAAAATASQAVTAAAAHDSPSDSAAASAPAAADVPVDNAHVGSSTSSPSPEPPGAAHLTSPSTAGAARMAKDAAPAEADAGADSPPAALSQDCGQPTDTTGLQSLDMTVAAQQQQQGPAEPPPPQQQQQTPTAADPGQHNQKQKASAKRKRPAVPAHLPVRVTRQRKLTEEQQATAAAAAPSVSRRQGKAAPAAAAGRVASAAAAAGADGITTASAAIAAAFAVARPAANAPSAVTAAGLLSQAFAQQGLTSAHVTLDHEPAAPASAAVGAEPAGTAAAAAEKAGTQQASPAVQAASTAEARRPAARAVSPVPSLFMAAVVSPAAAAAAAAAGGTPAAMLAALQQRRQSAAASPAGQSGGGSSGGTRQQASMQRATAAAAAAAVTAAIAAARSDTPRATPSTAIAAARSDTPRATPSTAIAVARSDTPTATPSSATDADADADAAAAAAAASTDSERQHKAVPVAQQQPENASSHDSPHKDCISVECGPVKGLYSCSSNKILYVSGPEPPQQAGSSKDQGELWMGPTAFMRLAGAAHAKHSADTAISVLQADGSKAMSLKSFLKQWHKNQQAPQVQQLLLAAAPSSALAGVVAEGGGATAAAAARFSPAPAAGTAAAPPPPAKAADPSPQVTSSAAAAVEPPKQGRAAAHSHGLPAAGGSSDLDAAVAAADGDNDVNDGVLVRCGPLKGWYSNSRDRVLLLEQHTQEQGQQQQPLAETITSSTTTSSSRTPQAPKPAAAAAASRPSSATDSGAWMTKGDFMRLAGPAFTKANSNAAIYLVEADGSKGITVQGHLKRQSKQKQQQSQGQLLQQQTESAGLDASAAARRAVPASSKAAAAGAETGTSVAAAAAGGASAAKRSDSVDSAAPAPADADSTDDLLAVSCGTVYGWFSRSRGEVLLVPAKQQQQQQQGWWTQPPALHTLLNSKTSWLTRSAFKKLGGMDHVQDPSKAIKLVAADGSVGVTFCTYLKQQQKARGRQQQQPMKDNKQQQQQHATKDTKQQQQHAAAAAASTRGAQKPPRPPKPAAAARTVAAPSARGQQAAGPSAAAAGTAGGAAAGGGAAAADAARLNALIAAAAASSEPGAGSTPVKSRAAAAAAAGGVGGGVSGGGPPLSLSPRSATEMLRDEHIRDAAAGLMELWLPHDSQAAAAAAAAAAAVVTVDTNNNQVAAPAAVPAVALGGQHEEQQQEQQGVDAAMADANAGADVMASAAGAVAGSAGDGVRHTDTTNDVPGQDEGVQQGLKRAAERGDAGSTRGDGDDSGFKRQRIC